MIGKRQIFGRLTPFVSRSSTTMFPCGSRTAMAVIFGPRIMIPSISACPPMEVFLRAGHSSFSFKIFVSFFFFPF